VILDEVFGSVPPDWWRGTLGEVCAAGGGEIQTGPFGSQLHASSYVPDGVPTIMPVNIGDNRVVESGIARVPESDADRLSRHRCRPGDIVYSRRGDVERRALIREHERGWLCGTGCLRVRVGEGHAQPEYVSFMLGHPRVRAWISQHAVGATMPNLNTAILAAVPAVLPPLDEQRRISSVLTALDDKAESNRRRAEIAEQLLDVLALTVRLPLTPLRDVSEVARITLEPAVLGAQLVDHFSLPAFDDSRLPERTPGVSIKSNKFAVERASVLVSRLNPRTNRTWYAVPEPGVPAAASTEFLVLRPAAGVSFGALWLAVRTEHFRSELARRATGTSGSHQRLRPQDALSVEVPDVRLLSEDLAEEAAALLRLVHHARVESTIVAELRDTLLPELVSGRLRVEPATEFVESGGR
jgi:type I restriction enzyme, S subunit